MRDAQSSTWPQMNGFPHSSSHTSFASCHFLGASHKQATKWLRCWTTSSTTSQWPITSTNDASSVCWAAGKSVYLLLCRCIYLYLLRPKTILFLGCETVTGSAGCTACTHSLSTVRGGVSRLCVWVASNGVSCLTTCLRVFFFCASLVNTLRSCDQANQ